MSLAAAIRAMPGIPCRPWPRHVLAPPTWSALGSEPGLALLAMWADAHAVHALLRDAMGMLAVSVTVVDGRYPALSPARQEAALFERAIADLWGHAAEGGDTQPWLDHGAWESATPMAARPATRQPDAVTESAGPVLPIGPLAGGLGAAGLFRLELDGTRIARAQARLGFLHRGIPALTRGKSPRAAGRFAARLSGEATVAHSIAFARAAEAACDTAPPPRAIALRAAMAEAERMASHLADISALASAAGAALVPAPCQRHREALLRAAALGWGHRLMMDAVVPGGLAADLAPAGEGALRSTAATLGRELPALAGLCAPLRRRLEGVAVVPAGLAPGGPAGRAMGQDADLRRAPGYRPYHDLNVPPTHAGAGDAAARLGVLLDELRDAARMLRTLLAELPGGAVVTALPQASGEGFGWAEGPRGGIWTWLRLEAGQIAAAWQCDPGWLALPALEAALAGMEAGDWAVGRASFGVSYAGMDL